MNRLESHVEAIVGPLRASDPRKDRMRDELLAHLEAARDSALDRGSDDAGAVESAISRFGAIDALRAEIQASVPTWERRLCTPVRLVAPIDSLLVLDPARDRTPLRFAARRTVSVVCLLTVVVAVALLLSNAAYPSPPGRGSKVDEMAAIALVLVASTFASFYALEKSGARAKLDLRSECSAGVQLLHLVGFGAFWVVAFLAPVLLLDGGRAALLFEWVASWSLAGAAVYLASLAAGLALTLMEMKTAKRRYKRWGTDPRIAR